ncbi:MAG: ATP-binding protein, partial [bacterium]|nr:ATP-binding protein [bacterium]
MGDGVSIQNRDYKILFQNEPHIRMIGHHVGEYCYQAYEQNEQVCRGCPLTRAYEDGQVHTAERSVDRESGVSYFEITASPLKDAAGRIIAGIELVRDITDRRRMEGELQKIEKLESLGVLAGGIAHDFNNLLTAILGNLSYALSEMDRGDPIYERIAKAEQASLRAKGLTRQLLTFSKGGAPVRKITSITPLVRESASFGLRGSHVKCEFFLDDDLWLAEVDEGQIGQVIQNIVINGDQAMPHGGVIEVGARNFTLEAEGDLPLSPGNYIRLSIRDQGFGIPEAQLDKIFDPFFTTKASGSGLGLSTSFSIIKKHGGLLTVQSEESVGSIFEIYLPATESRRVEIAEAVGPRPTGSGRVLLMDDERFICDAASKMLEAMGYEVTCVPGGVEAVEAFARARKSGRSFDCVIMDLTIPGGMGGKEAIGKLREIDPQVKAVVSSGYSNDPVMADYRRYGFQGVLRKPYVTAEIARIVEEVKGAATGGPGV